MKDKKALLKRELFSKMEREIRSLEGEINHAWKTELKCSVKRKMKIGGCVLRGLYPYALTAGILVGGGAWLDGEDRGLPFCRNNVRVYENFVKTSNSDGEEMKEVRFENVAKRQQEPTSVRVYENWTKAKDGVYERKVETYKLDKDAIDTLTQENIVEILKRDPKIIEEILGQPIASVQKQLAIPPEREQSSDYRLLELRKSGMNKDAYVIEPEPMFDTVARTGLECFMLAMISFLIMTYRYENRNTIQHNIERILKANDPRISLKELQATLAIKRQNYELMGGGL